ncbi:hypothetical protein D3C72_1933430 [compost metagenome]
MLRALADSGSQVTINRAGLWRGGATLYGSEDLGCGALGLLSASFSGLSRESINSVFGGFALSADVESMDPRHKAGDDDGGEAGRLEI